MSNRNREYLIRKNDPGLGTCLGALALIIGIILFIPFVLMLAWNTVMPYLFGLPTLEYPQAFALWLVFTILTGVIRGSTTSKG